MKCPYCQGGDTRVIDTREANEGVRRRRECTGCGERFTTYEHVAASNPMVVKRDGRREEFDRAKLLAGVRKACAKRPIAVEEVERLVNAVESRVQARKKGEVKSRVIGDMVMKKLKELDEVAYIRFASVYLPLDDLNAIKREVDRLLEQK
ncbi:MAG: transcriptional regulator NrdR [Anaerolineae bacterium]